MTHQTQARKIVDLWCSSSLFWLRSKLSEYPGAIDRLAEAITAALSAAEADGMRKAESRVRDLEAGLRPFAKQADQYDDDEADLLYIWCKDHLGQSVESYTLGDLRRARALLSGTAEGDGWLPIESAPRDGTLILIFKPPVWRDAVRWHENDDGSGHWLDAALETVSCEAPTHWRPFPAPPAPSAEAGER